MILLLLNPESLAGGGWGLVLWARPGPALLLSLKRFDIIQPAVTETGLHRIRNYMV